MFRYPGINLLVVTGGEAVVNEARKHTDKRLIAAGAGNPPVVVDETADIPRAARDIVCLNAGAALYAANVASSIEDGMARAQAALEPRRPSPTATSFAATTPKAGNTRAERCLRLGHGQRPIAAGRGTAGRCAKNRQQSP